MRDNPNGGITMRKALFTILAALVALTMLAGSSLASVTFDATTGTGFVGKGDVQTVLGFNNKAMQAVAPAGITFGYDSTTTYTFTCTWETGQEDKRKTHTNDKEISSGVAAEITKANKVTGQYTGWFLNGYATAVDGSDAGYPIDADCGAAGNEMKSIVPGSVESSSTGTGLYFQHLGVRYPLAITPVL